MWRSYGNRILKIKMISLSQEWAILSKHMYGQEFINGLAEFFKQQGIKELLECGCGDGHVLRGLAEKGFTGIGIDASPEMISMALQYNQHPNIRYQQLNWLDLEQITRTFDCVMCRGNSLTSCVSWEKEKFDPEEAKKALTKSLELMFGKLNQGGLLYIDTVSQNEINNKGMQVYFDVKNFKLIGKTEHDWKRRIRRTYGKGIINGEEFLGEGFSYLIRPDEMRNLLQSFNPSWVWTPDIKYETNYRVICARK